MRWKYIKSNDDLPPENVEVLFDFSGGERSPMWGSIEYNGKLPSIAHYDSSGEKLYEDPKMFDRYLDESPSHLKDVIEEMEKKQDVVMWDAINGDFYEHDSLASVLKDLKENYCDPEEGIHPDIETIRIFREIADVSLEPVEGKENTFRVKVVPKLKQIGEGSDEWICKCERKHGFTLVAGYSYCNQCGKRY